MKDYIIRLGASGLGSKTYRGKQVSINTYVKKNKQTVISKDKNIRLLESAYKHGTIKSPPSTFTTVFRIRISFILDIRILPT